MSSTEDPSATAPPAGRTLTQLASIDVDVLKGVGPKRKKALEVIGVDSVLDLLWLYPRRYIDRTRQVDLADLAVGEEAVILGTVTSVETRRTRQGRPMVTVTVDDATASMEVTFFNQAWRAGQLSAGTEALFFGKLEEFRGRTKMTNPVVDVLVGMTGQEVGSAKTGRIISVYPQSQKSGVTSWDIGRMVVERQDVEGWGKAVVEQLAADLRNEFSAVGGFSASNLWRMKAFFEAYTGQEKLAPLVREISWSHNIVIMEKCKDDLEREFLKFQIKKLFIFDLC